MVRIEARDSRGQKRLVSGDDKGIILLMFP